MSGLTPKQEAFAHAYVETGNATEAYRRAYDVEPKARDHWITVEACQLLEHPEVSLRVTELREAAAKAKMYTIGRAYDEYEEARLLALKVENPGAAVSAVSGKVKLFGLERVKPMRVEHTGADGAPLVSPASELLTILAGIASRGESE